MLGIVILNYKTYEDAYNCIESIYATTKREFKIYIVDNNSPNDSYERLCEKYANDDKVTVVKNPLNNGYSAGNNIGFRMAVKDGCKYILCSNSDVTYFDGTIDGLCEYLDNNPTCGVVGPKVLNVDGTIQNNNKNILDAKTFLFRKKGIRKLDFCGYGDKYFYANNDFDVAFSPAGMVSGCSFMLRSEALIDTDYFDENIFLYHEEDVLGAKLRAGGKYYVEFLPEVKIIHAGGQSTGGASPYTVYHENLSGLYYLWNYGGTSKVSYNFTAACLVAMFRFAGIKNAEYKKYASMLKKNAKEIKSEERVLNLKTVGRKK